MSCNLINKASRVSRLLQPIKMIQKGQSLKIIGNSKSYQLMLDLGIIRQTNKGMYTLLPLGVRALDKLINIVDEEMSNIGAQKILLPNLTDAKLWTKTGRLEEMGVELFKLKDRHSHNYLLAPTHEEAVTDLIADIKPQKDNLPLLLYQISNKWRDEMRPRMGLFRSREFIMKDAYSFDISAKDAEKTYNTVTRAYNNILNKIGLPYSIAEADTGVMGGTQSHEYHYNVAFGEDIVSSCTECGFNINSTIYDMETCKKCGGNISKNSTIEIAHTFLLGTKYSEALQANCHTADAEIPMIMGCFGLGLTRLLAATLEILSVDESLRWPYCLAPYTVCLVPPKENSKQSPAAHYADSIMKNLADRNIDAIIDDRLKMTVGRRMLDAKRTGYPYIIVVGRSAMQTNPLFEIHDISTGQQQDLSLDQLYNFFDNCDFNLQKESLGVM